MTPNDDGRADGQRFLRAFCDPTWGAHEIDDYMRGLAEGQREAPEQHGSSPRPGAWCWTPSAGRARPACAAECLHFIGIEQDAESVETARRRLGQAQPAQLELGAA